MCICLYIFNIWKVHTLKYYSHALDGITYHLKILCASLYFSGFLYQVCISIISMCILFFE